MKIPHDLLTEYQSGRVLIFVGQGINGDEWTRLAWMLAERLSDKSIADLPTSEVAQEYKDINGLNSLIRAVRDFYRLADRIHRGHRLLASLMASTIFVTTCLDDRIERAFAEAGRDLNVIVDQVDRAYGKAVHIARLYKLHGTIERPETIRLTEKDIQTLYYQHGGLSTVLKGHLADNTIVFAGFALDDPFFQQLYLTSIAPLDRHARHAYGHSLRIMCLADGDGVV